jgi:hypothetical protein
VADLSFIVDDRTYPDTFIAKLFGISTKTVQRRFPPAIKNKISDRNNRTGAQIKAFALERRRRNKF